MDERPATDKNDICHHKKKTSWDMLEKVNAETKWIKRKQNHVVANDVEIQFYSPLVLILNPYCGHGYILSLQKDDFFYRI